ncbi:hypothetical protein ACFV9G_13595 [Nocardioides sp. NPDC059952]|uniref:hypothetical protein n=1 Tax=Nocardioides sp. NPDC059952 TaxID=3347014 RepID=UPI0036644502
MTVLDPDDRAERALELHLAGLGYDRIAEVLGYANRGGAFKAAQRALTARKRPGGAPAAGDADSDPVDDEEVAQVTSEIARLDAMRVGLWSKARKGDVQAVDRVIRIGERQMELRELLRRRTPPAPAPATSLTDFEKRLRERQRDLGREPVPESRSSR